MPAALALANALFWYFPARGRIMGWGDDPYFNLWIFEHDWDRFAQSGPLAFWGRAFWESNIFFPHPLTLALSENYAYASLLSWPLRFITGDGLQAMGLLCVAGSLAAFFCAARWLESLGVQRLQWWGGLVYAACGWVQTQSAHYQNAAIFLFPLALWTWNRFLHRPRFGRLLVCAAAFGWVGGWNSYFQVFANVILLALAGWTAWKRPELRLHVLGLLAATVLVELPLAYRYLELRSVIGDYSVGDEDRRFFAARISSFFFHKQHRSLMQRFAQGFYPRIDLDIEAAGFIGYAWLLLWIRAVFARSARGWALAALAAWVVALGPDYLLLRLLSPMPGLSYLRAIGRAQIVSMLFSLPAVFLVLESNLERKAWRVALPLLAVLLELAPGRMRDTVQLAPDQFASPRLARQLAGPSLLVVPEPPPFLQLDLVHLPVALYSGYSGRWPAGSSLVGSVVRSVRSPQQVAGLLRFSQAELLASVDAEWTSRLQQVQDLEAQGCEALQGMQICVFRLRAGARARLQALPRIALDRDTRWEYSNARDGRQIALLRAAKPGVLDLARLARCRLEEKWKLAFLPEISRGGLLEARFFRRVDFAADDVILERISADSILRLPEALRPATRYQIVCGEP